MSFQAITTFFRRVGESPELRSRVQKSLDRRPEAAAFEIVDVARAHGCDFTATELREYLAAERSDLELSDEQLEAVAGGVLQLRALNLTGLSKIRMLPLDKLRARRMGRI